MTKRRIYLHYLGLFAAIVLGAFLRFGNLDLKPLWLDEVMTAVFSVGKSYNDLPLDLVLPLESVKQMFAFKPGVSCLQIATNVAHQSTHPPLFFCGMYSWLSFLSPLGQDWVEKLRSVPALFGVGAIAAIYGVNRIAFSPKAGIMAAFIMAGSPFAVYLSQEARHYTVPMLLISLALLGLMKIQQDISNRKKISFWVWIEWVNINIIGLYVHYFFILALVAQIGTLILLMYWRRAAVHIQRQIWQALIISTSVILLAFIPWLMVLFNHANRSETEWLASPQHIAPVYQTLMAWVLMVIALPVENQPLPIIAISVLFMLISALWIGSSFFRGLRLLWQNPTTHLPTFTLLIFTGLVLLELVAIAYILRKDITLVPRYHFIYYPSFCALLAASFCARKKPITGKIQPFYILLFIGIISSIFVISNLAFQKSFTPEKVAQNMNQEPSVPLMLVVGYRDYQDVALGLSFALALDAARDVARDVTDELSVRTTNNLSATSATKSVAASVASEVAIFKQVPDFSSVWRKLSVLPPPKASQLNLWVVAPGIWRRDYPQQVALSSQMTCNIDTSQHYRIGVPYQLYRCKS
jgi:uncharacterized membrane protein